MAKKTVLDINGEERSCLAIRIHEGSQKVLTENDKIRIDIKEKKIKLPL
jgi:hypothetical protein